MELKTLKGTYFAQSRQLQLFLLFLRWVLSGRAEVKAGSPMSGAGRPQVSGPEKSSIVIRRVHKYYYPILGAHAGSLQLPI